MGKKDTFDVREYMFQNRISLKEGEGDVSAELNKLNYKINDYYKQVGEVGWAMKQAGYEDREIEKVHKEFEKVRDLHNKTVKRLSRKLDK